MASQSVRHVYHVGLFFLTWACTALAAVDTSCYAPNGAPAFDNTGVMPYVPCNTRTQYSMCCRSNSTDTCRGDGLCDSSWDGNVWRDFCSDPTWRAPECVKLCLGTSGTDGDGKSGGTVRVTQCPNGSYCCGVGSAANKCCSTGAGVWIDKDGETTGVKPGSATTRSSTTTSSSSTAGNTKATGASPVISTTGPASEPSQSRSAAGATVTKSTTTTTTNTGAIAGGVVAGVVAVAVIVGAVLWALRRRRNRPMGQKPMWAPTTANQKPPFYAGEMEGSNARRELSTEGGVHEIGTGAPIPKQHGMAELA